MCRSVPHTDATFTRTRTSAGPKRGNATSRISAPGRGSGFTTAIMVSAIHVLAKFGTSAKYTVQMETANSSMRASPPREAVNRRISSRPLRKFSGGIRQLAVELLRFAFGNAQRFPLGAANVLGQ